MQFARTISLLCATGLVIALSSAPASADLLIYEPFDYTTGSAIAGQVNTYSPVGSLPNYTSSPTWNEAGTAGSSVHQTASSGLTYSGFLPSTGLAGDMVGADSTEFARLDLPSSYGINTSLYYSLLLNVPDLTGLTVPDTNLNANNDGIIMFNNGVGASGPGHPSNWAGELVIRLGSASGTYNLGIRASNTPGGINPGHTYWTGDITADSTTHLIVARYVQGSDASIGSDDSNDLWLDPSALSFGAPEGSEPSPDGSSQGTINSGSPPNNHADSILIGAGISAGSNPDHLYIDEIRVGTTWADVTSVPEPSTLVLTGFGLLGLVSWHRARRR